jgi:hypothetical protein
MTDLQWPWSQATELLTALCLLARRSDNIPFDKQSDKPMEGT